MNRLDTQLPSEELMASLNGNRAHASLTQEPEMKAGRRGPKLTADRRNVTALWNRSSVQAKDCMTLPMEPPALLPGQIANTSSGLKKHRLEADTLRAQEQYYQYKATHPVPSDSFRALTLIRTPTPTLFRTRTRTRTLTPTLTLSLTRTLTLTLTQALTRTQVPSYGFPTPATLEPGRANTRTALLVSQVSKYVSA